MIRASTIAEFLQAPLVGSDLELTGPRSLSSAEAGSLVFLSKADQAAINRLNAIGTVLCLATGEAASSLSCSVIVCDDPRLAFCKVLNAYFTEDKRAGVDPSATVAGSASLGAGVFIGPGARIDDHAVIGEGCEIGANVVIGAGVIIGRHCIIKPNTTIGARGFGFALDEDGSPVPFPHLGTVKLGDNVEIGANCTVVRAGLDATLIGDGVKTDDHVHIAHNCRVGSRTRIAAGAVLSGSVRVGKDVWISPNATIIDYAAIGDGAFIGIGSVVTKSVKAGDRVFGVPARIIGSKK